MVFPEKLQPGQQVAIISPATEVKAEYIDGAAAWLRGHGFVPVVAPHAKGPVHGSYASSQSRRIADFCAAFEDPDIKAVLCARGGYGAIHLLPHIPERLVSEHPKWLIGFSDISALHAYMAAHGVASLHAPMAKHLTTEDASNRSTGALLQILTGDLPITYHTPVDSRSAEGSASGRLIGGNLAVLNSLAQTPADLLALTFKEDCILFLEDVGEKIYAVERMLWRLYASGILSRAKGLIFGSYTDYGPDRNFDTMEDMISARLAEWHLDDRAVAIGFPVGHQSHNLPMVEGSRATLTVDRGAATLTQQKS